MSDSSSSAHVSLGDNGEPQEPNFDVSDFEREIVVRPMRLSDYDSLVTMQRSCFGDMAPWGRDQIESQLKIFPEGQIVVECDGRVVASSSSLILEYDDNLEWYDWK